MGSKYKYETVKNLDNKEIKIRTYPPVRVKDGLPKLSFLGAIVGSRGAGKTNCLLRLIEHYTDSKAFEKIIMFCPSWLADKKYHVLEETDDYDLEVYDNFNDEIFAEIQGKIKADMHMWWDYEKTKEAYEKYIKVRDVKDLTADEMMLLEKTDYEKPEAPNGWKKAPATLLIFDDMAGRREVYPTNGSKSKLHAFTILHRHWHCSILHVVQHYHGAVGKQIRNNLSLLILFGNKNKDTLKSVSNEFGGIIEASKFLGMWEEATPSDKPWEFFMCNFDEPDLNRKFRRNFNQFFILQ